ncbi:hypothetical protein B0H11DRAFT_2399006 [Mycena galericulata]|nr:hypothetical protein B0H11DRAFT_2399006 [Mycena galericulata]
MEYANPLEASGENPFLDPFSVHSYNDSAYQIPSYSGLNGFGNGVIGGDTPMGDMEYLDDDDYDQLESSQPIHLRPTPLTTTTSPLDRDEDASPAIRHATNQMPRVEERDSTLCLTYNSDERGTAHPYFDNDDSDRESDELNDNNDRPDPADDTPPDIFAIVGARFAAERTRVAEAEHARVSEAERARVSEAGCTRAAEAYHNVPAENDSSEAREEQVGGGKRGGHSRAPGRGTRNHVGGRSRGGAPQPEASARTQRRVNSVPPPASTYKLRQNLTPTAKGKGNEATRNAVERRQARAPPSPTPDPQKRAFQSLIRRVPPAPPAKQLAPALPPPPSPSSAPPPLPPPPPPSPKKGIASPDWPHQFMGKTFSTFVEINDFRAVELPPPPPGHNPTVPPISTVNPCDTVGDATPFSSQPGSPHGEIEEASPSMLKGRPSKGFLDITGEAFEEIRLILERTAASLGVEESRVLNRFISERAGYAPGRANNFFNTYSTYANDIKHRRTESGRIGKVFPADAQVPPLHASELKQTWPLFKDAHAEGRAAAILDVYREATQLANATSQSLGQRKAIFDRKMLFFTNVANQCHKEHGFDVLVTIVGQHVNEDGGLGGVYTTPNLSQLFEKINISEHDLIGHCKTVAYGAVQESVVAARRTTTNPVRRSKTAAALELSKDIESQPGDPVIKQIKAGLSQASVKDLGFDVFTALGKGFCWTVLPKFLFKQDTVLTGWPYTDGVEHSYYHFPGTTRAFLSTLGQTHTSTTALEARKGRDGYGGLRLFRIRTLGSDPLVLFTHNYELSGEPSDPDQARDWWLNPPHEVTSLSALSHIHTAVLDVSNPPLYNPDDDTAVAVGTRTKKTASEASDLKDKHSKSRSAPKSKALPEVTVRTMPTRSSKAKPAPHVESSEGEDDDEYEESEFEEEELTVPPPRPRAKPAFNFAPRGATNPKPAREAARPMPDLGPQPVRRTSAAPKPPTMDKETHPLATTTYKQRVATTSNQIGGGLHASRPDVSVPRNMQAGGIHIGPPTGVKHSRLLDAGAGHNAKRGVGPPQTTEARALEAPVGRNPPSAKPLRKRGHPRGWEGEESDAEEASDRKRARRSTSTPPPSRKLKHRDDRRNAAAVSRPTTVAPVASSSRQPAHAPRTNTVPVASGSRSPAPVASGSGPPTNRPRPAPAVRPGPSLAPHPTALGATAIHLPPLPHL